MDFKLQMSPGERYSWLLMASLSFSLGYSAAMANPGPLSPIPFAPLLVVLLGVPVAMYFVGIKPPEEVVPEEPGMKRDPDGVYRFKAEGSDGPVLLEDLATLIRDPRSGQEQHLEIPCVTVAEFARKGWQLGYVFGEMNRKVLADGLNTRVGRVLWTDLTDCLNDAHLIRKQHRAKAQIVASLRTILRAIEPYPMPASWKGWERERGL